MDERPPEGQEEEEADEHHRDEMRQAFVLNPGNLFVVIRQQLGERFLCRPAGEQIPDAAITTDLIVAFPGETEEDFLETIDIVKKVQYDSAFTFLYSVREGTEAAKMENQVPDEVKHERFDKLLDVLYPIVLERNQQCIGKVFPVLVESAENGKLTGRTEHFRLVHFKGSNALIGEIVNVKITNVKTFHMEGEFVSLL